MPRMQQRGDLLHYRLVSSRFQRLGAFGFQLTDQVQDQDKSAPQAIKFGP